MKKIILVLLISMCHFITAMELADPIEEDVTRSNNNSPDNSCLLEFANFAVPKLEEIISEAEKNKPIENFSNNENDWDGYYNNGVRRSRRLASQKTTQDLNENRTYYCPIGECPETFTDTEAYNSHVNGHPHDLSDEDIKESEDKEFEDKENDGQEVSGINNKKRKSEEDNSIESEKRKYKYKKIDYTNIREQDTKGRTWYYCMKKGCLKAGFPRRYDKSCSWFSHMHRIHPEIVLPKHKIKETGITCQECKVLGVGDTFQYKNIKSLVNHLKNFHNISKTKAMQQMQQVEQKTRVNEKSL